MDTIFALSTPPGKSGVAILRVSGPHAAETFRALGMKALPEIRKATLAELTLEGQETLDRAIVLYFKAPHSFTGEDIAEYHVHGSRAVIARLLAAFGALPSLRPAEPGEFTRRAFLNGKIDLTGAEGLADLIDAETEAQRRQAIRFMQGEAESFYRALRLEMLETLALTEAYIDFPDEEIPESAVRMARENVKSLCRRIESQLNDSGAAERVRDGVQVTILGPPNAGKSSLMNLLARRNVAIVSHQAGTTRDVIEVHLDINGYAVIVADTAGLREAENEVEREGIRRSHVRAEAADIRILMLDASVLTRDLNDETLTQFMDSATILLLNKTDLALPSSLPVIRGVTAIPFCAKDGGGIQALLSEISNRAAALSASESSFITRSRHRHHLSEALKHLQAYTQNPAAGLELQCEELRRAGAEIGRITGTIAPDEVLGQIFSRFCIGK